MHFATIFSVFLVLGLVELCIAHVIFPGKILTRSTDASTEYDYIIVGAGTSGLVVANRLSEDPKTTVLVIEAGDFHQNEDWVTVPLITSGNIPIVGHGPQGSKYDWNFTGAPQTGLVNRTISMSAGKVVGGSSVLNGMIFNRGSKADYDRWEKLGNPGWNFDGLLPYLKKAEHFTLPEKFTKKTWDLQFDHNAHGNDGYVWNAFSRYVWPSTKNIISALKELNVSLLKESISGDTIGTTLFSLSLNPLLQSRSTSQDFYEPAKYRSNLHLLVGHQVTKVLTQNGTVGGNRQTTGIEYAAGPNAPVQVASVTKEVVLAAGALRTPAVLQLSGIGFKAHLAHFNITPLVDLPGVGSNYQDHISFTTSQSIDSAVQTAKLSDPAWRAEMRSLYDKKREGPYTTVGGNVIAFLPLSEISSEVKSIAAEAAAQNISKAMPPPPPGGTPPTLVAGYTAQHALLSKGLGTEGEAAIEFIFSDESITPSLQLPLSRGTVLALSTNAFIPPVVDQRYLANAVDVKILVEGFKYARTLRSTSALKSIGVKEINPGLTVNSDDEIISFIKSKAQSANHHAGTAAMMPRELGGVVDSELKVYGVDGLRVVDASIIPILPAAHLQATVYGIAEKAADLIKGAKK